MLFSTFYSQITRIIHIYMLRMQSQNRWIKLNKTMYYIMLQIDPNCSISFRWPTWRRCFYLWWNFCQKVSSFEQAKSVDATMVIYRLLLVRINLCHRPIHFSGRYLYTLKRRTQEADQLIWSQYETLNRNGSMNSYRKLELSTWHEKLLTQ